MGVNTERTVEELRDHVAGELARGRRRSVELTDAVDDADLVRQHSPLMSPLVWDLAHIASQEELWLVRDVGGRRPLRPEIDGLYDAFQHSRASRVELPLLTPEQTRGYVTEVREKALDALGRSPLRGRPLEEHGFAFGMIIQHEQQHAETMLATHQLRAGDPVLHAEPAPEPAGGRAPLPAEVVVPAGPFTMGTSGEPWALDNERPAHRVELPAFVIDAAPVTNGQYAEFIAAGGYRDPRWWSAEGWRHRTEAGLEAPQFWLRDVGGSGVGGDVVGGGAGGVHAATSGRPSSSAASSGPGAVLLGGAGFVTGEVRGWWRRRFGVVEPVRADEPVVHVCYHEAAAYAAWAGRRLPTEAEWEKAARWDPASGASRRFPWGDGEPTPGRANLGQRHLGPAPVGAYPDGASPLGVHQLMGDVWEWCDSGWHPYPGFRTFPYPEYSEVFFGGDYRVLRGGSFGTDAAAARATFRNWDHPIRRQIFSGFRCARDATPAEAAATAGAADLTVSR